MVVDTLELVGLIPAGGQAKRAGRLPVSKELYPVGYCSESKGIRPKVACEYLLRKMRQAGIRKTFIVIRDGKWDIPSYLGDGNDFGMHLAYLMLGAPYGVPYTLDQAYPFIKDSRVALGFPDIVFEDDDAFCRLTEHHMRSEADVVLGLFPADRPDKVDMVELGSGFEVQRIVIKPQKTQLALTWAVAVWNPRFSEFMHEFLKTSIKSASTDPEIYPGDVVQASIKSGLRVEGVQVSERPFLDIGTPDDLLRAIKRFLP